MECIDCGTAIDKEYASHRRCAECGREYFRKLRDRDREAYNAYQRGWRKRNKGKLKEQNKERRIARLDAMSPEELAAFRKKESSKTKRLISILKEEVYAAYGGYKCSCCGETEPMFLTVDHINNDGASHRKSLSPNGHSVGSARIYRWLKNNGYPEGFQILCMNCQFGRKHNNGTCPHQSRCNDYPERE